MTTRENRTLQHALMSRSVFWTLRHWVRSVSVPKCLGSEVSATRNLRWIFTPFTGSFTFYAFYRCPPRYPTALDLSLYYTPVRAPRGTVLLNLELVPLRTGRTGRTNYKMLQKIPVREYLTTSASVLAGKKNNWRIKRINYSLEKRTKNIHYQKPGHR